MKRKRLVARPLPETDDSLLECFHPVMRRIYLARGIRSPQDLDYSLSRLPPPSLLHGIEAMTARLVAALAGQKRILVVADYDADGATACALAVKGMRALGARRVDFVVPSRFRFGYGLTPALVEAILAKRPEILLTVDNGIANLSGVQAAKAAGLEVLITDHHLPGGRLPSADAIVNPHLPDCAFPSKALAGVGVMFYVLCALRARLREEGWFEQQGISEPKLGEFLDLVALGTVADVVPLDDVNRTLVYQGLQRMRAGRACPGIQALLEVAGRDQEDLTAADLGFALGPRLNAAGRLQDMALGIRCLLADEQATARLLAKRLDDLNRERREIEARMQAEAMVYLESKDKDESLGICLCDPSWHEGVIGILASRLRDRLGRPAIAFAPGEDGYLKGSARSVPEIHIRDLIAEIDALRPGLIVRYGGHAMAAGLTLAPKDLDEFACLFADRLAIRMSEVSAGDLIYTDGRLNPADFSLSLAAQLRAAGPWGQGFPEPSFHGEFEVQSAEQVKERHLKLILRPPAGPWLEAIAFGLDDPAAWLSCRELRLVYRLDINEFRGERKLQLKVDYLEPIQ